MIKLFKNIRRKLLTENRFNKYLLYAVGEIVLVVIGILFALQINSWNQNRLLRIEEVEVVARIMEDIEAAVARSWKTDYRIINHSQK